MGELLEPVPARVVVAVIVGLVIGAEREQRMREGAHQAAGIRTFALTAMLGAIGALLEHPAIVVGLGAAIAIAALVAYKLGDRTDPGLTSEIALVLTYALGVLALSRPSFALALGISAALLLAFRSRIHTVVQEWLSPSELRDALIVAAAALVVLPMIPDRTVDPWEVLNPFTLWRLVVVILAIHLAAHVAQRVLGPRWGLPLAGLASGFVSSSATIAAMGNKAKENASRTAGSIAAATASTVATFAQMAILIGAASPRLLASLSVPLIAGGVCASAYAASFALRAAHGRAMDGDPSPSGRAVDLRGAVLFALLVTAVTIGATLLERAAGSTGVVIGAAIAAFADAHASGASIGSVHAAGQLDELAAQVAVLACFSTNTVTKIALAFSSGPRAFAIPVTIGVVLVIAAAWIGWALGADFE